MLTLNLERSEVMEKKAVLANLEKIADLMDLQGENPFRSRAFRNASHNLQGVAEDLEDLVRTGELKKIPGIGPGLFDEINAMVTTGESPHLKKFQEKIPEGVLEMLGVPGLGPKKVKILFEELGLSNLGELEYACKENRLLDLKGFGAKTQENVLKGISLLRRSAGRFLLEEAWREAQALCQWLRQQKEVSQCEIAGSLRRYKETIGDIDLLVTLEGNPSSLMKKFCHHSRVEDILGQGETKSSVRLKNGIQVDLRAVKPEQFAFAWVYFTGSKEHNTVLRKIAKDKHLKLNEYGLFQGEKSIPCQNETELYRALGLHFIPPEARENLGEIEFATKNEFPRLIENQDIRGIFHAHSTWSDGRDSILDMAQAAEHLGYEYLGLSDHSQSAFYAGGLKPKELNSQAKEIANINRQLKKLRVIQGVESDILADGSLDYEDTQLRQLDFIIASIHSGFKLDKNKMTQRILKALRHPQTKFLGHISGRLLLARDGFDLDYEAIFEEAAKRGVVIEINANPHRLDLDWRYLKQAKNAGVLFSINPDAHSIAGLSDTGFGVGIARKGWLTPKDILNTRPLEEVREFLSAER